MHDPLTELKAYVRHASISTDPQAGAGMRGARDYAAGRLRDLGFAVEVVETPRHPILLGRWGFDRPGSEGWPHVLVYGHYDVQPADPLHLWTSPAFEPEVRGERLYGRGAADNKGPQIVHMAALEQVFARHPELPLRITYLIEGEEEIGSPSFGGFLEARAKQLAEADFVLVSDTGGPSAEQIVVTTGLRGLAEMEFWLEGPSFDLHSGIHGGAVMNPLQALAEICASLHLPDGTVNVEHFYDEVLPVEEWEREEMARYPISLEEYRQFLGVPAFHGRPGFSPMEATRFQPTLEFNGLGGGYLGEGGKTVIPRRVLCKITCRLVPNQDPHVIAGRVEKAIRERCPGSVRLIFEKRGMGYPYLVVPPGKPNTPADQRPALQRAFAAGEAAIHRHFGRAPLYLREGGSIPIMTDLKRKADLDCLLLGIYTPEDRMHAPDESFHLGVMAKAIPAFAEIFEGLTGLGPRG